MSGDQLEALMRYIRAVAAREAVLAACGSDEGGYAREESVSEAALIELMLGPNV